MSSIRSNLNALLVVLLLGGGVAAQDLDAPGALGSEVTITLTNGNTLTGTLVDNQGIDIVIDHDLLGRITIPRTVIRPPEPEPAPAADEVEPVSPWSGTFDARLAGSSGNTVDKNYGAELNVRHETEETIDSFLGLYSKESTDDVTTKNQAYGRYRHEWILDDSRWLPFFQLGVTYDEFRNYDYRAEAAAGAAYEFIKQADERFLGRLGGGASKEVGADDDDIIYEALLGLEYAADLTKTNHIALESTWYPSLSGGINDRYRVFSKGEWRLDMSEHSDWYYKLGVVHQYQNDPDPGDGTGDLNYYVGIGTAF